MEEDKENQGINNTQNNKIYSVTSSNVSSSKNQVKTAHGIANALVSQAKLRAEELIKQAKLEASNLVIEAEKSGLEKGQKKAFSSLLNAECMLAEVCESSKEIILEIAKEIAKEMLNAELSRNPRILIPKVEKLLNKTIGARKIRISSHPEMIKVINENIGEYIERDNKIEIIENNKLELGDLLISTELGEINAKVEYELDEISQNLRANSNKIFS